MTRPLSLLSVAAAAGLLAGCSLADDYVRPLLNLPTTWKNKVAAAPAAPEWPTPDWWQRFRSPRLNEMMAEAQRTNFDIGAAVARVREADAQLRIAGAPLLPSVSATGGGVRERSPYGQSVHSSIPTTGAVVDNTYTLGLSASYEIDFWGKNRSAEDAAVATSMQSRYDARTTQLTVQSSVATTYFDMVGQTERLLVAQETVTNALSVLQAYRDRLEAGTATALDVAQQESVVAVQRATIPPLEQQIRTDENALAVLVGRMPEDLSVQPELLSDVGLPIIQPGLGSDLLVRRPDVQSAEQALISANANIANARAQLFPTIALTGQGGLQSVALSALLQHTSLLTSFGASVVQVIFDNGKLEGGVDYSRARYDELVQTYRKAVVSAFSDVENALVAIQKTAEEEAAQRVNVTTSRNAYEIAQAQLIGGTVDITTVLNTQKSLFSAQDALAQARLAHLQAVVGLYKALGGGWDAPPAPPGK